MNNPALQDDWEIAVILSQRPQVIPIPKGALAFDFQGEHFEDVGLGYHNGFYDFLRSRTGAIIGIRYLPWPDAEITFKGIVESEDIIRSREGELPLLLLFWGPDRSFDPTGPCDQCFGNNVIYQSKLSGQLAIGFATDVLDPDLAMRRIP
jgi:hypothetical protein